jgi:hypothetical protein
VGRAILPGSRLSRRLDPLESGSLEFGHFLARMFWTFGVKCVSFNVMKQKEALKRRLRLTADLPPVGEILRGSLLQRTIRHKKGCAKCERGDGHPVWVLTVGYPGGVTKQFSLRPEAVPQIRQWLQNYRELKSRLEAICETNHAFLRPEE